MNIFTNDDYRRIQAWLKANAIKDSEFAISENTVPDKDILIITQNMSTVPTNCKIKIKDLLNSSLGKVVIDKITANIVKVNNSLTVDASKVILNNEKGTTLQDVLNYFADNKLNRHTDDTFDGNLTVKKNITIEGNIKSHDDTITVEANLEATGEITDSQGNMLSDVNDASKGWKIEYQDPQQDEPTVRAKYVLKDYRGVPKGNVIKIYKDSAITNVYLGTIEDTCDPDTGEVTKHPIHDNNEALSIVYRLDTGKYSLVNVPIKMFATEAEFDKYRGLGVTSNGQVFIKLASDIESSNYLHFNELGEITADGIETRILKDLGNIITSVAGDRTMWGQYKKEEGTKDSPINEASRWGQYKQAESDRSELLNIVSSKVNQLEQAVSNERSERTAADKENEDLAKEGISKAESASAMLFAEEAARKEADLGLNDLIEAEVTERLQSVATEAAARKSADDELRAIADEGISKADSALSQIHEERQERTTADAELQAKIAILVPSAMTVEAPKRITWGNVFPVSIKAVLSPVTAMRNLIYLSDNKAVEVSTDGVLTPVAKGVSRVHVIPTQNTALARTCVIEVGDPRLRLSSLSALRFTQAGGFRLT